MPIERLTSRRQHQHRKRKLFQNFICIWSDFLVFSNKDDKPEVPSHNTLNVDNSVGRERTHAPCAKGRVIPVLWLYFVREWVAGWVGEVQPETALMLSDGTKSSWKACSLRFVALL